jgi:hypothetical protein
LFSREDFIYQVRNKGTARRARCHQSGILSFIKAGMGMALLLSCPGIDFEDTCTIQQVLVVFPAGPRGICGGFSHPGIQLVWGFPLPSESDRAPF